MRAIKLPSKQCLSVLAIVLVVVGCLLIIILPMVRDARRAARRSAAYGQLCYMRLALEHYEYEHGTLPPLCLRDNRGQPILSWRALILPYIETKTLRGLELAQPWNSDHNRRIVENTPLSEWAPFARDRVSEQPPAFTHIFALLGSDSIWSVSTGLPKGKTTEHPNAILLISVPESRIEPLQPGDITEDEVRKMIENGQEVFFIRSSPKHGYGVLVQRDLTTEKKERDFPQNRVEKVPELISAEEKSSQE